MSQTRPSSAFVRESRAAHRASRRRRAVACGLLAIAAATSLGAQEAVDRTAIDRLKEEGFKRSQVMDITSWLTDVYGSRLTNAPSTRAAAEWSVKKLGEWGLVNARLEPWGPFGRGWVNERFVAQVVAPYPFTVIGYANAWTPGTNGAVTAEAVWLQADSVADLERYRGKLRGKVAFTMPPREVRASFAPLAERYTDEELAKLAEPLPPRPAGGPGGPGGPGGAPGGAQSRFQAQQALAAARTKFLVDEGVVAVVVPGRGDGGTVFVSGAGGSRDPRNPAPLPQLTFAVEHYNRIVRALQKGVPIRMELDVRNRFHDEDLNSYNIIAEIPGTDPQLKGEIVMLGAHFDSWQAGTGATDNAAGTAVMMEAVRLIRATGLRPKRTIRIALWTGEEQGLLGSRAYVTQQFADRQSGAR
ncbi:MAG TPA: M20/M25/M40 family metallo-hydrolase, partial [Gemmatimonadales bacterium]|nr:M20/M25/M40 family metallo-hydrolase [Gemmatimonadales bacterium]